MSSYLNSMIKVFLFGLMLMGLLSACSSGKSSKASFFGNLPDVYEDVASDINKESAKLKSQLGKDAGEAGLAQALPSWTRHSRNSSAPPRRPAASWQAQPFPAASTAPCHTPSLAA